MTNTDNLIENVAKEISIEYKQFAKHIIVNKKSKVETDKHSYNMHKICIWNFRNKLQNKTLSGKIHKILKDKYDVPKSTSEKLTRVCFNPKIQAISNSKKCTSEQILINKLKDNNLINQSKLLAFVSEPKDKVESILKAIGELSPKEFLKFDTTYMATRQQMSDDIDLKVSGSNETKTILLDKEKIVNVTGTYS